MTRNNGAEQLSHAMVKFFADYATEYEHSDPQNIRQPLEKKPPSLTFLWVILFRRTTVPNLQ